MGRSVSAKQNQNGGALAQTSHFHGAPIDLHSVTRSWEAEIYRF